MIYIFAPSQARPDDAICISLEDRLAGYTVSPLQSTLADSFSGGTDGSATYKDAEKRCCQPILLIVSDTSRHATSALGHFIGLRRHFISAEKVRQAGHYSRLFSRGWLSGHTRQPHDVSHFLMPQPHSH